MGMNDLMDFEYKVVTVNSKWGASERVNFLNQHGFKGWVLSAMDASYAYFFRPKFEGDETAYLAEREQWKADRAKRQAEVNAGRGDPHDQV